MRSIRLLFALTAALPLSSAFRATARTLSRHQKLNEYVSAFSSTNLNISLNIETNGSHLHISGMSLTLQHCKAETASSHATSLKMPGKDGPLPQLSSGIFPIQMLNPGSFIGMNGHQSVLLQNPIWEMCWSDGAPSGSVVFGFRVPQDYTRNGAQLSSTESYYCTFAVFSRDGLEELQRDKKEMMEQVEALMKVRRDAVEKVRSTYNPIIKAAEYGKALDAMERLSYYDMERIQLIPSNKEVLPICQSIMIANTGQLWSRGVDGKRVVHGTAFVSRCGGSSLAP
jgi:hypothetical protein